MKNIFINLKNKPILISFIGIVILLIITGFLFNSFALNEPISSISFVSEKLNYKTREPGSWKVEKSAKWISADKARITFDVDTIVETKHRYQDIVFILDTSSSMSGNKIERVKSDTVELLHDLLSDSTNQASLITFNNSSEILSDFTSNKEELINKINVLEATGATNYYQALVKVDSLLKTYTKEDNRDLIALFLTDGYPCIDTPNEVAYFKYLKEEYPYLVMNGIQYEMGNTIFEPIKKVSDNQYLANMTTLNNILLSASVLPTSYENFVLTDYIDTDNFYVEDVNDIKVSQGRIEFNKKEQKITWMIDNLKTGSSPSMTIDVKEKEESKNKELLSTNKKESVESKLDSTIENIESDKTPILKGSYQVIYEDNAPSGCSVSNLPKIKNYHVFDTVEIDNNKPACEGYQFKGWKIVTEGVTEMNQDYFLMPENDVVIRAEWSNMSISKSMDGEVYEYMPPIIKKVTSSENEDIWQYKSSITKVVFQNSIQKMEFAREFDISEAKNSSVMAYVVSNRGNLTTQTVYIQGEGGVIANQDSSFLFYNFSKLTEIEGLEYFDTSNVTSMRRMFGSCQGFTSLDLSSFDTSKVTDMSYMFSDCSQLANLNVSTLDTSSVTNMSRMFSDCRGLTSLDVSNFDTSKVTDMSYMFSNCNKLTDIDLSSFKTSSVTDMRYMFSSCSSLTSLDVNSFDTLNVTNMSDMFYSCATLTSLDLSNFNTLNVTNMSAMFQGCRGLTDLNVSGFNTCNVKYMSSMFKNCSSLTTLNISNFITENVTAMYSLFEECSNITSLNLSNFNTSKVTDMSSMFSSCIKLTSLDVGNFDTSNVTNMTSMFERCYLTSLDVSHFDTSKVTTMEYMFWYCSGLTSLDISNFDTPNVTNMHYMFSYCSQLVSLNVSNFDTSKVTNMSGMFNDCKKLVTLDVSTFNTSSVTDMSAMFSGCSKLTSLDISNFDTSNVTDMEIMFSHCEFLTTTITILNPSVKSYQNMFSFSATRGDAKIVVNYTESTSDLVTQMIATRSATSPNFSYVIKGTLISPSNVTIVGNEDIQTNPSTAYLNQQIELVSISNNYRVTSFKMNGVLVKGNKFSMPDTDAIITDIGVVETYIVESEHNPYPDSLNDKVYGEKTFDGATSLTVTLDYQTGGVLTDVISLYDSSGNQLRRFSGSQRRTETFIVSGNYIKISFTTDSYSNNYYGFKAVVFPNYD